MNLTLSIANQVFQSILMIALAPLLVGWIRQTRAWLSNKKGAGILQPYCELRKLFLKEPVLAENASVIFRFFPYFYFSAMCLATIIIPTLSSTLPLATIADVIVLVGIFSLTRIFLALAAMDIGTAFGSMGARREMLVAFLVEPALLMVFFNVALMSESTILSTIVHTTLAQSLVIDPSLVFAAVAFFIIVLAENGRIPVDNPSTHLELTMIHEAMILEYSGRYLALIEWASDLKLLNYFAIAIALFFPWGIMDIPTLNGMVLSIMAFLGKAMLMGVGLTLLETVTAKMRIFRVPELLTGAFMLAILGVLIQLLVIR